MDVEDGAIIYLCVNTTQYVGLSEHNDLILTTPEKAVEFTLKRHADFVRLHTSDNIYIPVVLEDKVMLYTDNFEHITCFNENLDNITIESIKYDSHCQKALFTVSRS